MLAGAAGRAFTVRDLQRSRAEGRRIVAVTAYTAPEGRLCDAAGVDLVLVGDSLGNVLLGLPDTLGVTLADMVRHTQAVAHGVQRALLVADLPFLSYQASVAEAVHSAGQLLQAGAAAVKLEGGAFWSQTVRHLVAAGIPVVGHLGFTPQSVHRLGGPRVQARSAQAQAQLLEDARALEEAGVSAIVLEMVPSPVAAGVSEQLRVPTIGIGAGPACGGQVLVLYDLLGLSPQVPRFARRYADLRSLATQAVEAWARDVREGGFPGPSETHDGTHWGGAEETEA